MTQGESAGDAARRFAAFLAEAVEGQAEDSQPAQAPASAPGGPERGAAEIRPSRARSGLEQPFSLTELPPEKYWYQALILPPDMWGAGARQVIRWLEGTTTVQGTSPVPASPPDPEGER